MRPVPHLMFGLITLTVRLLELDENFGQLHLLKSKILDNRSLFEIHQNEIFNVHDDENVKNSFLSPQPNSVERSGT
jgi:hypothetical protein